METFIRFIKLCMIKRVKFFNKYSDQIDKRYRTDIEQYHV